MLINVNVLPTPYQRRKIWKIWELRWLLRQDRRSKRKMAEEGRRLFSKINKTCVRKGRHGRLFRRPFCFPYLPSSAGCLFRPDRQRSTNSQTMGKSHKIPQISYLQNAGVFQSQLIDKYILFLTNWKNFERNFIKTDEQMIQKCSWVWQKDQTYNIRM